MRDEDYRRKAKKLYHEDGEIEVDDDAEVSWSSKVNGEPAGAYVQAWVWVDDDEAEEGEET